MLKTNYRCVQSLNISVDVAKCVENVQKFTQFTHFLSVTKNDLSWLNNLFMAKFQLISMSSYAKNKLQMCSVAQHQCRRCQMCGKCSHINSLHSLLDCYKKRLVFTEQSIHWKFQVIRMSSYAKNKLQMCSVTQHQCRRRQMCGKCSQIHQVHSLFVRTCPDWTNLFKANFQLTRMSSYAKNKLQMCSVTQHQCRRRQMCGKCSNINSLHSLLDCYKKRLCDHWTIYSWQSFNSWECPLMLRTNYRFVQSLNISGDVAKCVENVHKFTQFTHFLSVTKNDILMAQKTTWFHS